MKSKAKPSKESSRHIDLSRNSIKSLGTQIRKANIKDDEIGKHLELSRAKSAKTVYNYTKALVTTQKTRKQFVTEGKQLFDTALGFDSPSRKAMFTAVLEETGRGGSLFLLQNMSVLKKKDVRTCMKDLLDSGGTASDVAVWLQLAGKVLRKHNVKSSDTAESVVDAVGEGASWVLDAIEDGVDTLLESIDAIIDAITDAGASLVDFFEEVVSWTASQIGDLLKALVEAGKALIEFVGAVFDWTYKNVSKFIKAALEIGFSIAELLETVVSESYWVFRRFINGIIQNLGPIGDVMDFILTQVEDAVSVLWEDTLQALRYAKAKLEDVLDWMADKTAMVFESILRAWETIGEDLIAVYEWALEAGATVWRVIGEVTITIGNSFYYVYNFLTTSGVQFIFDFTRGMLDAGLAIGGLIGWAVGQAVEICGEVIRAALDAGVTIGQMLVEIIADPRNALTTFMRGLEEIGQTLEDLFEAVIIETSEEFVDEIVEAAVEIGHAAFDILVAVLEISGAALTAIVTALLNLLGTYRPMRAEEIRDARKVFGNALDYQLIFLSTEDPVNEILFGVQDFFTKNPDSRAFVTSNLINFDVDDGEIDRPTLIHELTHVWQHREIGGIYMAEAIIAQATLGDDAYNYGYDDVQVSDDDALDIEDKYDGTVTTYTDLGHIMGEGGDAELNAANGDISAFNPEMQGQIMMHWFVRKHLTITDQDGNELQPDTVAWDPYQQFVFNS